MYITYPIILGLARLRLVSFVLVLPMRSLVSLHGDVDEGDGGGGFFCITGWRYVVHLSEKSGWCLLSRCGGFFPFWVALSADDSGSPASLEAAVLGAFGDATANARQILPVRSTFQVQIEAFDVPIIAASKNFKASSSRRGPVSRCKLVVFICQQRWPDEWWLRSSLMKMIRWSLQGPTCIFSFARGHLYKQ